MKNELYVKKWLKRANSNLSRAQLGKLTDFILYEDLVSDCQQAVEKGLKALLIANNLSYPRTHSIGVLIDLLTNQISVPEFVKKSVILSEFVVATRYPENYEAVTENEYLSALNLAEKVVIWIQKQISI